MAKNPFKDIDYPLENSKPLRKALKPGKKTGAVSVMSPQDFLSHAKRLKDTKEDRLLIDSFKSGMKNGKKFKALKLLENNMADGRHRATAAEEVGIEKVPVIDYRDADLKGDVKGCHSVSVKGRKVGKATGGALSSTDPNRFMQDVMKFSFQILPLLRPGYLKEVPKQGFAHGGHVLEDDYPTEYLPNVGRQVMADGGVPRFAPIDMSMLLGLSQQPYAGGQAYTDVGGQKIAAPFATGMFDGYPTFGNTGAYTDAGGQKIAAPYVQSMMGGYPTAPVAPPAPAPAPTKKRRRAEGGEADLSDLQDLINRALGIVHRSLGGYVSKSEKIPNYGTQAYETDEDRLHKKMKEIEDDENEYE